MSIENTILEELKQQILTADKSFANKVYIGNNPEKYSAQPYWIMLSLVDPSSTELTMTSTLRNIDVEISFYRKNTRSSNYDHTSVIKENLLRKIPRNNRPYWHNFRENTATYNVDLDVDDNKYEGFELGLEFHKVDTITCTIYAYPFIMDTLGYLIVDSLGFCIFSTKEI